LGTTTEGEANADTLTIAESGNAGITIRSGTSATGSIYFSDDTSGGGEYDGWIAYNQNSRYFQFGTAQAERLRITSAGAVGIGSALPQSQFEVYGSSPVIRSKHSTSQAYTQINHDGTDGYLDWSSGGLILRGASNAERVRIASNGMVGIGTDVAQITSSERLSVFNAVSVFKMDSATSGSLYLRNADFSNANNPYLVLQDGSGNRGAIGIANNDSAMYIHGQSGIRFRYGGSQPGTTEAMRINSSGNVGIGTDNPNYTLVVAKQNNAVMIREGAGSLSGMATNTSQKLWFQGGNAELGLFRDSGGAYEYIIGTWQSATHIPLVFRTANRVERMRITFDGQVLVGSSTVQGHANMDDLQVGDGSGNRGITISSGTSNYGTVAFGDSTDGSGTDRYAGFVEYYHNDNSMRLGTSSAERFRITSGGNVGIGSDSPSQILDLRTGEPRICLNGSNANSDKGIEFEHNNVRMGHLFHNPTSGEMSLSVGENTGGAHYLTFKAGNGTEKMRIASNGHVGIDCTPNDQNGFTRALDVNGPSGAAVYMRTNDSTSNLLVVGNYGSEAYINNMANGNIRFYTQGVEKLRLTNTGRVGINTTTPTVSLDLSNNTDAVALPTGTTAQRPSGTDAYIRKNSTNNALEFYNGTEWVEIITDYFPTGSTILG
jgi:hypothetical protein